jgi:hypothetical protein
MANYTQAQCDSSTLTREKLADGSWFIRGYNSEGQPIEFADTVSASNASLATSKTNAHAFMKANCEYLSRRTAPTAAEQI